MKLICLLFFSILIVGRALALPNPAAVYCERLGYEYKRVQTSEGEKGIVVIEPGVQFDAWDFFKGKVGKEYSFGALCGYDTECVRTNIGTYAAEYAVGVPKRERGQKSGMQIPLRELMEQKGAPLFDETITGGKKASNGAYVPANRDEDMLRIYEMMGEGKMIPAAFDWRTNNSHAYIGSIRDQGSCGSCYSFAAAASAEGTYNWAMGKYDADCADFSESYIIWCLGRLPQYNSHFFGCGGADYDYAELTALAAEGICDEADFPYTESDPGSCEHWSDPVTVFGSWHRVLCGDIDAIKTAIMTYGVVDAAVYAGSSFQSYSSGIYTDANTTCYSTPCYYTPVNHAIALVGWDDNPPEGGGGCWILRNSWGASWGENGYMRIRYNAARVACEVCYLIYLGTNTQTLNVTSTYGGANPAVGISTHNHGASITCSITNSPQINGTTQFSCTGWAGAGSVPAAGNDTNTGPFTLTNNSAIVWQWQTNFYLNIDTNGCGSVDMASGWKALDSNVVVTATPASFYRFVYWSGDTGNCTIVSNKITITMNMARTITANFSAESLSAPTDVSASDGTFADKVKVSWGSVTNATGYTVWRSGTNESNSAALVVSGITTTEYNDTSAIVGVLYYYWVKATNASSTSAFSSSDSGWRARGRADPVMVDNAGNWYVWFSGSGYQMGGPWNFGVSGTPVAADFDGDGYTDVAIVGNTGNWYVWFTSTGYRMGGPWNFGVAGTPVAADFDGDRYSDPAVVDNNGVWYVWLTSAGYQLSGPFYFGVSGIPVAADFDGDWYADPAMVGNTLWYIWLTTMGYQLSGPRNLGISGTPVAADFDGDRYADSAMVDDSGAWYIWFTSAGYQLSGPFYFGVSGIPVAADFDGR